MTNRGSKRRRRRRSGKPRLRPFEWVLVGIMAVSSVALIVILAGYARDQRSYAAARALAVSTPVPAAAELPAATPAVIEEAAAEAVAAPVETPPIAVDFDAIRAEGKHVRGWLYSAGTVINYPVTYYTNNSYYLTHDYTGKHNKAGALFFDTRAGKELAGDNLIIYGHHMKDGSMFKSLMQYQKQSYYDEHPVMYLLTLDGNFRIDLFAGRFTDSDAQYYPMYFVDDAEKASFWRGAVANSDFTPADADYRPGSRMVSLVTCAYSNYIEDSKYQVLGWLEPIA